MTKDEFEKEAEEKYFNHEMADFQGFYPRHYYCLGYLESAEPREKRIAELEKENAELQEKISVLLSCKKCPENKGGWICVKEYENKCLSQKIVYIKELKKENAELKAFRRDCIKLTEDNVVMAKQRGEIAAQLTKAKEIIKKFLEFVNNEVEFEPEHPQEHTDLWNELCEKAEQFISEVEK